MSDDEYEGALDELDKAEQKATEEVGVPVSTWRKIVKGAGNKLPEDLQHWADGESDASGLGISKKIARRTVDELRKGTSISARPARDR